MTETLFSSVQHSQVLEHPFGHLWWPNVFGPNYSQLIDNLPDDGKYTGLMHDGILLKDGTSPRGEILLDESGLGRLGEKESIWRSVRDSVIHPDIRDSVFSRLRPWLVARFGEDLPDVRPEVRLTRDVAGYRVCPHSDTQAKALTQIFYLARDDSKRHVGTVLYDKPARSDYQRRRQMPYTPDCGLAFAVNDRSWHGVEELGPDEGPRDCLMLMWYIN